MVIDAVAGKSNFSVKSKGTEEFLRHNRTEKHLRKDQRWRYEHLKSVDAVKGKVHHSVRGRNGKVLTKLEFWGRITSVHSYRTSGYRGTFPF